MKVLMLGQHLELGWYRSEFLRAQGYDVIFPETRKEAVAAIQEGRVGRTGTSILPRPC